LSDLFGVMCKERAELLYRYCDI